MMMIDVEERIAMYIFFVLCGYVEYIFFICL